jgi:hypothetical protein
MKKNLTTPEAAVIVGFLTLLGVVINILFDYITQTRTLELSIQATQTAEAKPTPLPTVTLTAISTPRFSSDCEPENLIFCGVPVPIFIPEKNNAVGTFVSDALVIEFFGQSGMAFRFDPPLNVRKFSYLEVVCLSDSSFLFVVEYKVKRGEALHIVATSTQQLMPESQIAQTLTIPISYFDVVDEIVLNFFEENPTTQLTIESLRLK